MNKSARTPIRAIIIAGFGSVIAMMIAATAKMPRKRHFAFTVQGHGNLCISFLSARLPDRAKCLPGPTLDIVSDLISNVKKEFTGVFPDGLTEQIRYVLN